MPMQDLNCGVLVVWPQFSWHAQCKPIKQASEARLLVPPAACAPSQLQRLQMTRMIFAILEEEKERVLLVFFKRI